MRTLFLAAVLAAFSLPALGHSDCGPYAFMSGVLSQRYGEKLVRAEEFVGGIRVEEWRAEGTWTLLQVRGAYACHLASGRTVKGEEGV